MSSKPQAEKTYTESVQETVGNVVEAVQNSLGGAKQNAQDAADRGHQPGQPSIGSKLGDAWESAKEAGGIAGDKGAAKAEDTKVAAAAKKDEAAYKTEEAKAGTKAAVHDARKDLADKIDPNK